MNELILEFLNEIQSLRSDELVDRLFVKYFNRKLTNLLNGRVSS